MSEGFLEVSKDAAQIPATELKVDRAKAFAQILNSGSLPYVVLVKCQKVSEEVEIVILDIEVERPQKLANDIKRTERIAAIFFKADDTYPEVLALRETFPAVPHINLRREEFPRSICLYEEPFEEVKLDWTPLRFLERIRAWLTRTALGTLHTSEQPLEPVLAQGLEHLILPNDIFSEERLRDPKPLRISGVKEGNLRTLIAEYDVPSAGNESLVGCAITYVSSPQVHGFINHAPGTLHHLHEFLAPKGIDLISDLRSRLKAWYQAGQINRYLNQHLWLILSVPMKRRQEGPVEHRGLWAFATNGKVEGVGVGLGIWQRNGTTLGLLVPVDRERTGKNLTVELLNPHFHLSRTQAASLNGDDKTYDGRIVSIGCGSLGSQVFDNLFRAGFGRWTLIDNDIVLPHNLARHCLPATVIGCGKAHSLSVLAALTMPGEPPHEYITDDVAEPTQEKERITDSLSRADLVLDMTASLSAARSLSRMAHIKSPVLSLFLSPTGRDLVALAETRDRSIRIDEVEMQYYRLLIETSELHEHLSKKGQSVRYARSCRDLSSTVPQDAVALNSAIASRAIRQYVLDPKATVSIWSINDDCSVARFSRDVAPTIREKRGDWEIIFDAGLMTKIAAFRKTKLPNETGGVLVGSFDTTRQIIYLVDALPSPSDSIERPHSYIRGTSNLKAEVRQIESITAGRVTYVGEWHAHPLDCSVEPSGYDLTELAILAQNMESELLPAVMLIIGDDPKYNILLGTIEQLESRTAAKRQNA